MALLPRAALLLLALAIAFAPAVSAEEAPSDAQAGSEGTDSSSSQGNGTSDPVEEVEECVCNETEEGEGNETAEPECTLPSCVTDPEERAACAPAELNPWDGALTAVEVDPDGCYRAAVKKVVENQHPVVRNFVCSLLARIP